MSHRFKFTLVVVAVLMIAAVFTLAVTAQSAGPRGDVAEMIVDSLQRFLHLQLNFPAIRSVLTLAVP